MRKHFATRTGWLSLMVALIGVGAWRFIDDRAQRQRIKDLGNAIERLVEISATAAEVKNLLGEPEHILETPEGVTWFYSGPIYRGRRQKTIVVRVDTESDRVDSVGFIVEDELPAAAGPIWWTLRETR